MKSIRNYLGRISGPLTDRIDLQIEVPPVSMQNLISDEKGESSATIRKRVLAARARQTKRFAEFEGIHSNAMMKAGMVQEICKVDEGGRRLLRGAIDQLGLSARAYGRILKVSRTIADLAAEDEIAPMHVAEAIGYRNLDRAGWAG